MLEYILLGLTAFAVMIQDVFKQRFNRKSGGGAFFFSGMIALFACLFFIAVNREWSYRVELLLPSFGFALSYAVAIVCLVLAIRYGSLAKTNLIISCSLLIPSFYGMIFLRESAPVTLIVGIVLLVGALVMINYEKSTERTNPRWVVFVVLAFVGNGMCSTVQKMETLYFGDEGRNLFMIVALAMVAVILLTVSVFFKEERRCMKETVRKGWLWALLCGLMNGLSNYLVIYLNSRLPASVMFPVISAGSVALAFLYATLVTKEKFNRRQQLGFLLGVVSIVLLNL